MAEAIQKRGKHVTIYDANPYLMSAHYDEQFGHLVEGRLREKGIDLCLAEEVQSYVGKVGKIAPDHY